MKSIKLFILVVIINIVLSYIGCGKNNKYTHGVRYLNTRGKVCGCLVNRKTPDVLQCDLTDNYEDIIIISCM